ncbi:MAG: DUF6882 domain-containing protein [Planctomycetota bacterium]
MPDIIDFDTLLHDHAGIALHRQYVLLDHGVGEYAQWGADLAAGELTFGEHPDGRADLTTRVGLLGSAAERADTWLWVWGNRQMADSLPETVTAAARQVRAVGEQHGIAQLTQAEWPLDEVDPHALATIATGIVDCAGYYRGPYDGGYALLLILDDALKADDRPSLLRVPTVFHDALNIFELADHRRALRSYVTRLGMVVSKTDGGGLRINDPATDSFLEAEFDAMNRLTKLGGKLQGHGDGE